jgi:DNA-binding response OmpR family regulator
VAAVAAVLVVEDDQPIRESLARGLVGAGHVVRSEATGAAALAAAVDWRPDVVVLDLGLPDIDGADVLQMLRGLSPVPVIVATARDDEAEIVRLLDRGADDYVVKPYSAAQLEARIRAVLRRAETTPAAPGDDEVRVGGLVVAPGRREASVDGRPLDLTRLEFDLLAHLSRRSPEVVTRRELLAEVWQQPYGGGDKTVDVHLSWLRRKLGETGTEPRYLHTVRGVGVKLVAPADG